MTGSVDAPFTPPERWFWSLPLLVLLAWFPIAPYWASDDFFALRRIIFPDSTVLVFDSRRVELHPGRQV